MARTKYIQTNFTAGEISPRLDARIDLTKYQNGAKTIDNFVVLPHGGLQRRGGSKFVLQTKNSGDKVRLVPFEFNVEQAYVLEFGDEYIRFYRNDGIILESSKTISGITQANPGVVTSSSHGYNNGDWVFISGVAGMTEVNDDFYIVAGKTTNTFQLTDIDGNNVNTSGFTAYSSAGTAERVYEEATPYDKDDLFNLSFTQSADILYVVHPNYAPREITRTGHTSWTVTEFAFLDGPYLNENATATTLALSGVSGSVTVTASATTGINSGVGFRTADVGRLIRHTHSGTTTFLKITGFTNTTVVTATVQDANAGGTSAITTWRLGHYYINNQPAAVTFFEERLVFGGSNDFPQLLNFSASGDFTNFAPGTASDDAMSITIATDQVNVIRWLSSGVVLAVGTAGGEFVVSASSENEALTPTNLRVVRHTTFGSAAITPLRVGHVALFLQRAQRKIREFVYRFESDTFVAPDLTLLAEHITATGIVEMAYQQEPDSVVWCCLTDGSLLGFTYQRDQEVVAWHGHIMGGSSDVAGNSAKVESIAAIPSTASDGAGIDQVYLSVKRFVDGRTYRHVEILQPGLDVIDTQEEAFFVDSGLSLNSPITMTAVTKANPAVVTASSHGLSNGDFVDIRDVEGMTELNNKRFIVANKDTNTFQLTDQAGTNINSTDFTTYTQNGTVRKAVTTITGLGHIEGETVSILANGAVQASKTVSSGAITLDTRASIVHVGLPYTSSVTTLSLEAGSDSGTAQSRTKRIHEVSVRLFRSLGVKVGPENGTLDTVPFRDSSDLMDRPPALFSGDKKVPYPKGFETKDNIQVQQDQPLPMTILALISHVKTND
tara:strand:- start:8892 stop:11399 length:2508 start_codon:yes stop_codon:yes gene_type:complete